VPFPPRCCHGHAVRVPPRHRAGLSGRTAKKLITKKIKPKK
jgi:hypothetical protein